MTDYNLIDRISAIKLELEYETENIYSILIATRNILHQSDEMTYLEIRNALTEYFNLNPQSNVSNSIINLITNPITANNNSMISILLNHFNQPEVTLEYSDELLYSNSESDDSDEECIESYISEEEILESDNENIYNHMQPIYDIAGNNITDYINNTVNNYNEYLSHLFYGTGNIQFNNYESNISNNINSILTLSNLMNEGLNEYQNNNNSLNLFTQIFNNLNNNQNQSEDIPIVLTEESYNKLIKCDYKDISDEIKSKNLKCMITLDEFKENDKVVLLPCEHVFKLEEITSWLKENSYKCPSCRNPCGSYYAKLN
jgi:hypothetical protein